MLNPEDFRQQLEKALVGKRQADQAAAAAETLSQQQAATRTLKAQLKAQEEERQQQIAAETAEKQRNQAALELDAQLPIRQHLEVLKDQIMPKQQVGRWGPEHGKIAYSLIYQSTREEGEFGLPPTDIHAVIGIIFNHQGALDIRLTTLTRKQDFILGEFKIDDKFNPLVWTDYLCSTLGRNGSLHRGEISSKYDNFKVNSKIGFRQFAQVLTDFYVGLKMGQAK